MSDPSPTPRRRTVFTDATWQRVVTSYLLVGGIVLLLYTLSNPLTGAAVVLAGGLAVAGARPTRRMVRCLRQCPRIHVDLGEAIQVTITRPRLVESCCEESCG